MKTSLRRDLLKASLSALAFALASSGKGSY